eukprot:226388_1
MGIIMAIFLMKKNSLNGTNGHYINFKIYFIGYGEEINKIHAVSGTVMKNMSSYPCTYHTNINQNKITETARTQTFYTSTRRPPVTTQPITQKPTTATPTTRLPYNKKLDGKHKGTSAKEACGKKAKETHGKSKETYTMDNGTYAKELKVFKQEKQQLYDVNKKGLQVLKHMVNEYMEWENMDQIKGRVGDKKNCSKGRGKKAFL